MLSSSDRDRSICICILTKHNNYLVRFLGELLWLQSNFSVVYNSIGHVSLFLKLIHVLPVYEWLLLYKWHNKLNAVVKWNGSYSKPFFVTRGTRQGSVLSLYLFNIFINQLLITVTQASE